MEYDAIIVGGGPAGLSAALLLGRCRRRVLICDAGEPRNAASRAMHGFLGRDGVNPAIFLAECREQLHPYTTVKYLRTRIEAIERGKGCFHIHDAHGTHHRCRAVLLATGVRDQLPEVPRAEEFYGVSLHHCPYCDAWEHRDQEIGVLGADREAVEMALELRLWSSRLTVFANSEQSVGDKKAAWLREAGIPTIPGKITEMEGAKGKLEALWIGNRRLSCEALFFSSAQRHQSDLAAAIGCRIDKEHGAVQGDLDGKTCQDGVFVAGNLSDGIQMAIMAAAEGVKAASTLNDWLMQSGSQPRR